MRMSAVGINYYIIFHNLLIMASIKLNQNSLKFFSNLSIDKQSQKNKYG